MGQGLEEEGLGRFIAHLCSEKGTVLKIKLGHYHLFSMLDNPFLL
jgi:hypothetical protein